MIYSIVMSKFEEYWFSLTTDDREEIAFKVARQLNSNTSEAYISHVAKQRRAPSKVMSEAIERVIKKVVSAEEIMFPERF